MVKIEVQIPGRDVTLSQLISWKLIKEQEGNLLASNAFVLLTSDYFPFSKTKCAVFKGKERGVFLDKREYDGPLYSQIDEAVNFVLRNIRLGAKIEGLLRREEYELPVDAIREMIVNAHCHRNLTDESCVQVAIYDDRLEVTSPGGLYNGLTFEQIMNGHSRLRNRAIANVFNQMGLVEAWGTGIRRIQDAAKEYGLPEPEFIEMSDMFRVNLYRRPLPTQSRQSGGEMAVNGGDNGGETIGNHGDVKASLLRIIAGNSRISVSEIAESLSIAKRTAERYIKELREEGTLIRHGSARGGYWEVK